MPPSWVPPPLSGTDMHNMKRIGLIPFFFFPALLFAQSEYVNPFIGTDGTGHTFPAAVAPFGMVQAGPDTRVDGSWEGCSGYHRSDSVIYGFSHTHLSGTGCSDYGDVMLMPYVGSLPTTATTKFYASPFLHSSEQAEPGYYAVTLNRGQIRCEMAATPHGALHQYRIPDSGKETDTLHLLMDLGHRDQLLAGDIRAENTYSVSGYRRSKAWAQNQEVFFYWEANRPFTMKSIGSNIRVFSFVMRPGEKLSVKVGLSAVGEKEARRNLEAEISRFDMMTVRQQTRDAWNAELSKINVTGGTTIDNTNFYTALYHTMIHPNLFSDVDGRYRGRDGQIHQADHGYYTVFSLWDTFRALHPLHALINRQRTEDFVKTFLLQYQQGGRLPMWELWCNETDCMIGYHAVSVLADAYAKGIPMDINLAFEAAAANANYAERSVPLYAQKGYLEIGDEHESVAKTLEYAYDDWCVAQLAKAAGKPEQADIFLKRSHAWINLLDPETGLMRPRQNGGRLTPFDPREVNFHYTEANAWQYSFFVPQDVYGLITAVGGPERFEKLLDGLFTAPAATTGRQQVDITGLIGQYAHGNEPSHHMAYLYNYVNRPEKVAQYIHRILTELYKPTADGLPGNEDCGQMSAWYVFSALGFYPVTPGSTTYAIGFPIFKESTIKLENGKSFTVKAQGNKAGNYFPQSIVLNGEPIRRLWLTHSEIASGGTLELKYGPQAVITEWEIFPHETSPNVVAAPEIKAPTGPFKQAIEISLHSLGKNETVFYTKDGSDPKVSGVAYSGPFSIREATHIRAVSKNGAGIFGAEAEAHFAPFPHPERKVILQSVYTAQYSAGGPEGLIDGVRGDKDWRKGAWQGYQDTDFDAELDLGKTITVHEVEVGFLQDQGAWILLPRSVTVTYLDEQRKVVREIKEELPLRDREIKTFLLAPVWKQTVAGVRYVQVKAANYGKLPAWHPGVDSPAFIFVDEIKVE